MKQGTSTTCVSAFISFVSLRRRRASIPSPLLLHMLNTIQTQTAAESTHIHLSYRFQEINRPTTTICTTTIPTHVKRLTLIRPRRPGTPPLRSPGSCGCASGPWCASCPAPSSSPPRSAPVAVRPGVWVNGLFCCVRRRTSLRIDSLPTPIFATAHPPAARQRPPGQCQRSRE